MGKRDTKRIENKSVRQATKQVIRGGHLRAPRNISWSSPVTERAIPIIVDRMPHRSSKKGCKRNKGGAHEPEYRQAPVNPHIMKLTDEGWVRVPNPNYSYIRVYQKTGYFCKRCNKRLWSVARKVREGKIVIPGHTNLVDDLTRPYPERDDHYSYTNIWARLDGRPCVCTRCRES
jgi:hypothetical protein